jgi:hypothetical protein
MCEFCGSPSPRGRAHLPERRFMTVLACQRCGAVNGLTPKSEGERVGGLCSQCWYSGHGNVWTKKEEHIGLFFNKVDVTVTTREHPAFRVEIRRPILRRRWYPPFRKYVAGWEAPAAEPPATDGSAIDKLVREVERGDAPPNQ